jgi:hypothetical protein
MMANSTEPPDLEMAEVQHPEGARKTVRPRDYKPATRTHHGHQEEEEEGDKISTIWRQVKEKNSDGGHYNFERFESMQLLNLCLLQHDLRMLAKEIFRTIGNSDEYPAELLQDKVERLRPMLKKYSMQYF